MFVEFSQVYVEMIMDVVNLDFRNRGIGVGGRVEGRILNSRR